MDLGTTERFKKMVSDDSKLAVGQKVIARWGYGYGFRASGHGTITKVFEKSVRVILDEDVMYDGKIGWHKGFELRGIPRYNPWNQKFDYWNSVEVIN